MTLLLFRWPRKQTVGKGDEGWKGANSGGANKGNGFSQVVSAPTTRVTVPGLALASAGAEDFPWHANVPQKRPAWANATSNGSCTSDHERLGKTLDQHAEVTGGVTRVGSGQGAGKSKNDTSSTCHSLDSTVAARPQSPLRHPVLLAGSPHKLEPLSDTQVAAIAKYQGAVNIDASETPSLCSILTRAGKYGK